MSNLTTSSTAAERIDQGADPQAYFGWSSHCRDSVTSFDWTCPLVMRVFSVGLLGLTISMSSLIILMNSCRNSEHDSCAWRCSRNYIGGLVDLSWPRVEEQVASSTYLGHSRLHHS